MNIKKIKIQDLRPAGYNPRKNLKPADPEYQKIKRSIENFGYVEPIIVNQDMTIIGGHQRVKVLQDLGQDEIDCVLVDLDKNQERALNIALNKIAGEWDEVALKAVMLELEAAAYDMSLTGFDTDEFKNLMGRADMELPEDNYNFDEFLESEEPPITKRGDIWFLGNHILMCGDSTKAADVKKLMYDKQAKLIISDPPYNINYENLHGQETEKNQKREKLQNDNLKSDDFYKFLFDAFKNMFDFTEPGAPIYIFHAHTESLNFHKAFNDSGFKLAECLVWAKNNMVLGRQDYHWRHEPILYGWKEGAAHHWYGERNKQTLFETAGLHDMKKDELLELLEKIFDESTILYEDIPLKNDLHPTMKPLGLLSKLIYNSSQSGDIILDLFGGSGSTLIAAEQTDRICYMMEINEKYCDVIVKRWEEATGKMAILAT